jgi:hypothetical protein
MARVAAFALWARGTEGAAGARADRRGTLDRAALKGPFDVVLHIERHGLGCRGGVGWADRAGERGGGQARKRQHHNGIEPLREPRLLVGRVLVADRRQCGSLDLLHVAARADLVTNELEVARTLSVEV